MAHYATSAAWLQKPTFVRRAESVSLGSKRTLGAARHFVVSFSVNIGLALLGGVEDRENCRAHTKLTGNSRASPCVDHGAHPGAKRPPKPKHVWAIRVRLELAANHRDLAPFNMAIDSKLRGCDLVRMKVADVMAAGQIKERASVLQSKTQKPVLFEISEGTRSSVNKWMEIR